MAAPERKRIYVASSWKNVEQPYVVRALLAAGHDVYDFRTADPKGNGFSWREVDPEWESWSAGQYLQGIHHPIATENFEADWEAMLWANTGVLVLPAGRSAHLEAGYFVGAGKPLYILLEPGPIAPELMYRMATKVCTTLSELIGLLHDRRALSV